MIYKIIQGEDMVFSVTNELPKFSKTSMSKPSLLLLKATMALENEQGIKFECQNKDDAHRTSKVLMRFIYDARKSKN